MELKKIQYFLSIVDEGSLSKAAQKLYLTQPTLSRFLAGLEEEAGVLLFRRRPDSSLELTEAGSAYLKAARQINKIWQSLESEFENIKKSEMEHIRVGIDSDVLHKFVRSCAATIAETYPNVIVETHYLNSEEIQRAILEGKIDIGLTSYYHYHDLITYTSIKENEVDLVVNKAHPIAKYSYQTKGNEQVRITLKELPESTPFLLMREGYVMRQCVDEYMEYLDLHPYVPTTFFRIDLIGSILADNDSLVSFCPRSHLFKELAYVALDPPFCHKRGICHLKGKKLTDVQKLLIKLLEDVPKEWSN